PDHELGAHAHPALEPLDDPDDVGPRLAGRHEVDHADAPLVGPPFGLEDQRAVAVAAVGGRPTGQRREQPAAVLPPAEDRAETGARVEAGERQPVDRAGAADERRRLQVAEERVVLDPLGHQRPSSSAANGASRRATPRLNARTYGSGSATVAA